jgi:hypothetical protein
LARFVGRGLLSKESLLSLVSLLLLSLPLLLLLEPLLPLLLLLVPLELLVPDDDPGKDNTQPGDVRT